MSTCYIDVVLCRYAVPVCRSLVGTHVEIWVLLQSFGTLRTQPRILPRPVETFPSSFLSIPALVQDLLAISPRLIPIYLNCYTPTVCPGPGA